MFDLSVHYVHNGRQENQAAASWVAFWSDLWIEKKLCPLVHAWVCKVRKYILSPWVVGQSKLIVIPVCS